jgi:virginiamycin B lyase
MRSGFVAGLAVVLALVLPGVASADVVEYSIPTAGSNPFGIVAGPDGALWFTESRGNKIGRITTTGRVTEFPLPTANADPRGIAAGADGALWFTESRANQIGRITTSGTVTEFPVPKAFANPFSITAGQDGSLWFTELTGTVGRITTSGTVTEFPTGRGVYITAGPDGALWFTEGSNKIGRITTGGTVTHFTDNLMDPTNPFLVTWGITTGPDGALWYSIAPLEACCESTIGRITTSGTVSHFDLNTTGSLEMPIAPGPDGALWFGHGLSLDRITTSGAISGTQVPGTVAGLAPGPDGAVWFTDYDTGKIGRSTTSVSRPSVDPLSPGAGATEVLPNGNVLAVFSEAMDRPSTQAAFSVKRTSDGQAVSGTFSWYGNVLIFDPSGYLFGGTRYTVTVAGSATGASGRTLSNPKSWSFTTTNRPVFDPVTPVSGATGVSTNTLVYPVFNKAMNKLATQAAFTLKRTSNGAPVAGTFAWYGTVLIFDPAAPLAPNTQYTATVAGSATDTAGRTLANPGSWKFTTGAA